MAQKALGTKDLSGCTLYTNVEPCAMCSFPIRETRISRVVYGIGSRLMGGDSKWDILADPELSRVMPEAFGEAPEVVRGYMRRDAEKAWRNWNPLIWGVIRYRGCFGEPPKAEPVTPAAPRRRSILQKLSPRTATARESSRKRPADTARLPRAATTPRITRGRGKWPGRNRGAFG